MGKQEPSIDGCPYLHINNCPYDKPTKFASLGARFLFTFLAWLVLGSNVAQGNSFFVSLMLFAAPLFFDYKKFIPNTAVRSFLRCMGTFVAITMIFVSLLGLIGILGITELGSKNFFIQVSNTFIVLKGVYFPIYFIWYIVGASVLLTGVDWVVYEGAFETKYIEQKQNCDKIKEG